MTMAGERARYGTKVTKASFEGTMAAGSSPEDALMEPSVDSL
jgi:hypothetical protein